MHSYIKYSNSRMSHVHSYIAHQLEFLSFFISQSIKKQNKKKPMKLHPIGICQSCYSFYLRARPLWMYSKNPFDVQMQRDTKNPKNDSGISVFFFTLLVMCRIRYTICLSWSRSCVLYRFSL